jgi:hypothetical protein
VLLYGARVEEIFCLMVLVVGDLSETTAAADWFTSEWGRMVYV